MADGQDTHRINREFVKCETDVFKLFFDFIRPKENDSFYSAGMQLIYVQCLVTHGIRKVR